MRLSKLDRISQAFAAWKAAHDRQVELEKVLKEQVELYNSGRQPFPDDLFDQVQQHRAESERLFVLASQALNEGLPAVAR